MPKTTKTTKTKRARRVNPSSIRADDHSIIGSVQVDGMTRIDVTSCVGVMPGDDRDICLEIVQEGSTLAGVPNGKIGSLTARMSRARTRAVLLLLLTAVEEG